LIPRRAPFGFPARPRSVAAHERTRRMLAGAVTWGRAIRECVLLWAGLVEACASGGATARTRCMVAEEWRIR